MPFFYAVFQQKSVSGMAAKETCQNHLYSRVHLPFLHGILHDIKKRTETLYQSSSPFMVEHRGVSSRASTALGQLGSEATLWPHSLPRQVLLPYAFMA